MPPALDSAKVHQTAVDNFVKLNLSYRFTASLLPQVAPEDQICMRFTFSKPTPMKPEPKIVVTMDVVLVSEEGTRSTYALYVEGQKYTRVIQIDSANVTGAEFNERLIDKVFLQKEAVRERHLWEP